MTFFTPFSKAALIKFCAPIIFVLTASKGLYSVEGTCLSAAAWTIFSTSFVAVNSLS